MPEYLAPGVYVEETSFRAKSIEGVSTTTTGFIGAARFGPLDLEPEILTSLGEFERMFGDRQPLQYDGDTQDNYLWHAVRAFFEEGGKRLYVVRAFSATETSNALADILSCCANKSIPDGAAAADQIVVRARFPGEMGNVLVRFELRIGQNILGGAPLASPAGALEPTVAGLRENDVVWIGDIKSPINLTSPLATDRLFIARRYFDTATTEESWEFVRTSDSPTTTHQLKNFQPDANPKFGDQIRVITLTVTVIMPDGSTLVWDNLSPDPNHVTNGAPDSLSATFAAIPANRAQARTLPIVITLGENITDGLDVLRVLFPDITEDPSLSPVAPVFRASDALTLQLEGGSDGVRPTFSAYEGEDDPDTLVKTGLKAFEDIEDISIIAAPGSTAGYELSDANRSRANAIINLLISHAERMKYRIAVLDCGDRQSISQVRAMRARFDSKYAAFYYPWIRILDPVTQKEIHIPPSGSVSGIYARNDINRAVWKAPANEVVNVALGFEMLLNKAQQDVLNPEGINAFRFFEGRGYRLWGARTISSDPEWKYVNLRRYFIYLERSIDRGTQWAVFEPNGEQLWANVRSTISDFLLNEWQQGALLGDRPEKAFFVRCDRSTMTQNDLDNGRLVCLIGVAPLRPAEFVIFRIGQWTADRRV
jgi:phage tail sheath protein FI